jgi:Uma2 family endonuclease
MTTSPQTPVLRAGDTLSRDEFERRYSAMPNQKKAELLEGVVYMPSPVRYQQHGNPHLLLGYWLVTYAEGTPGLSCATDATVRLDLDNEPQPDLQLRIEGPHGASRVDADGCVAGPPELVVEIAASSVSYDLHQKWNVYRRAGVREYVVLRTEDAAIDWFVQRGGALERIVPGADGVLRGEVFPGLWLDVTAVRGSTRRRCAPAFCGACRRWSTPCSARSICGRPGIGSWRGENSAAARGPGRARDQTRGTHPQGFSPATATTAHQTAAHAVLSRVNRSRSAA